MLYIQNPSEAVQLVTVQQNWQAVECSYCFIASFFFSRARFRASILGF